MHSTTPFSPPLPPNEPDRPARRLSCTTIAYRQPQSSSLQAVIFTLLLFLGLPLSNADPQEIVPRRSRTPDSPLLLAHYMPWYEARPESGFWGWHWTMNHFDPTKVKQGKREIASHFYPAIGPYDSGDPHVIRYHFLLMKLAGIDGIIIDWYGLEDFRDYAKLHANTAKAIELAPEYDLKVVVCYEDQTVPILVESGKLSKSERVTHVTKEIRWLQKHWFKQPVYLTLHDHPVLLSFGQTGLSADEWQRVFPGVGAKVSYFSQHQRRPSAIGAFDWPIPTEELGGQPRFNRNAKNWPAAIPVAFPRFVDIYAQAQLHDSYGEIADQNGQTLKKTLVNAQRIQAPFIQIATWNDWGEGTQVEPSIEHGTRDLEIIQRFKDSLSDEPFTYTDSMLSWPYRIYHLRKGPNPPTQELLKKTENLILLGKGDEAKRNLEQMERSTQQQ